MAPTDYCKMQLLHKLKDSAGLTVAANAIHDKIELLLKFLNNDDDEVSQGVIECAREYLQFLKNKASAGVYTASDSSNVEVIHLLCSFRV
ncbi:hypothetical protein AVEN_241588-1 [Araneus ventricosus]|uniref:Uncharacterized protein n=1 Tax=Araneus ventricosus TaxID=182803 RepID=A0A4Y2H6L8_ARAVE|nr:hypothetical protein AVEN_241588-1 [Araneus ventricosus]